MKSVELKLSVEWSHDNGVRLNSKIDFLVRRHTNHYIWGVGVGTLMGCTNPITLLDLCFTLEMATFELVA